jgi:hypothetical protein
MAADEIRGVCDYHADDRTDANDDCPDCQALDRPNPFGSTQHEFAEDRWEAYEYGWIPTSAGQPFWTWLTNREKSGKYFHPDLSIDDLRAYYTSGRDPLPIDTADSAGRERPQW